MLYHITYTKRDGTTEVGRISAPDRRQAEAWAAATFMVPRRNIRSVVSIGQGARPGGCPRVSAVGHRG